MIRLHECENVRLLPGGLEPPTPAPIVGVLEAQAQHRCHLYPEAFTSFSVPDKPPRPQICLPAPSSDSGFVFCPFLPLGREPKSGLAVYFFIFIFSVKFYFSWYYLVVSYNE